MTVFGRRADHADGHGSAPSHIPHHSVAEQTCAESTRMLAERLDAATARLERRRADLALDYERKTGHAVALKPLMLIPETCWRGRYGKFLFQALELCPYDSWNIALLPETPQDAAAIHTPQHPGDPGADVVHAINERIGEIKRVHHDGHEQVEWTSDEDDFETAYDRAVGQLKAIAAERLAALPPPPDAAPAPGVEAPDPPVDAAA